MTSKMISKATVTYAATETLVTAYDNASRTLEHSQTLPKKTAQEIVKAMDDLMSLSAKELNRRGVDVFDAVQLRRKPTMPLQAVGNLEAFRSKPTVSIKKISAKDMFEQSLDEEDLETIKSHDAEEITETEISVEEVAELIHSL